MNFTARECSGDVCGINQDHSAARESLSGARQLVTRIQAGAMKTEVTKFSARPLGPHRRAQAKF